MLHGFTSHFQDIKSMSVSLYSLFDLGHIWIEKNNPVCYSSLSTVWPMSPWPFRSLYCRKLAVLSNSLYTRLLSGASSLSNGCQLDTAYYPRHKKARTRIAISPTNPVDSTESIRHATRVRMAEFTTWNRTETTQLNSRYMSCILYRKVEG